MICGHRSPPRFTPKLLKYVDRFKYPFCVFLLGENFPVFRELPLYLKSRKFFQKTIDKGKYVRYNIIKHLRLVRSF